MSRSLLNLSGKIDPLTIALFEDITNVAKSMSIQFFVLGATARDILFDKGFDIKTSRATSDIDFAVQVADWNEYKKLKQSLTETGRFELTRKAQRLRFNGKLLIDIVPFGAIIDKDGSFSWPPEHDIKMSALGFKESFESSIIVKIRENPALDILFASLPGLALMKLISWDDRYPERKKDAEDLSFIMHNYLDAGNDECLFEEEIDIIEKINESGGFDYLKAGARLLGRDIAKIAIPESKNKIIEILDAETGKKERYKLVEDMIDTYYESSRDFEDNIELLEQLKLGILDEEK
jgi:predicted nucleotidyltransferase